MNFDFLINLGVTLVAENQELKYLKILLIRMGKSLKTIDENKYSEILNLACVAVKKTKRLSFLHELNFWIY